jgi:hypothetical protein
VETMRINNPKNQRETGTQIEPQYENKTETIELNNGEKWKIDKNMLLYIKNIESDVSTFSQNKQKDYRSLAGKLQTNMTPTYFKLHNDRTSPR